MEVRKNDEEFGPCYEIDRHLCLLLLGPGHAYDAAPGRLSRHRTHPLGLCGSLSRNLKAVFSLAVFAVFLAVVQLLGGGSLESAYVTGLRMLAMTIVFIILLTTTRLQDLTAALVKQIKIPYEYAFMFTAALRFVPDFIAESKAVQEAQPAGGCRRRAMSLRKSSII